MSPIHEIYPAGSQSACSISTKGDFLFPEYVIEKLGWLPGDIIAPSAILEKPLTLLFRKAESGRSGYKMSARSGGKKGKGGRITLSGFTQQYLRPRISLPIRELHPIIIKNGTQQIALVLESLPWSNEDFSMKGAQNIPTDMTGVYEILSSDMTILRIGEGIITNRIKEHLKNGELVRLARHIRYFEVAKDVSPIFERVLIAQYEMQFNELPRFNTIRA